MIDKYKFVLCQDIRLRGYSQGGPPVSNFGKRAMFRNGTFCGRIAWKYLSVEIGSFKASFGHKSP